MMIQEAPIGYGYTANGTALAGNNHDPNSLRAHKNLSHGLPWGLVLLVGVALGYYLHKRSRRG